MTQQPPPGQQQPPPYPPQPYPPQGYPAAQGYPPQPGFAPPGYPPQPLGYQPPPEYMGGVRCPKCGDPRSKPVSFTWWGGLIGPKILSHVKCFTCGTAFNGKTGRYNTTGILIYTLVTLGIVLALLIFGAVAGGR